MDGRCLGIDGAGHRGKKEGNGERKKRSAASEPSHTHTQIRCSQCIFTADRGVDSISSMSADINQSVNKERDSHKCL